MKDKRFWSGFGAGILSMLACLLLVLIITTASGAVNWRGLILGQSGSIMTASLEQKLAEIQGCIDRYYLEDIDQEQMEDAICQGMVAGLNDTYAAYFNETDYADMMEKTSGNYCGIGAYVSQNSTTGAITIIQPIEGSPAQKAGLQVGDVIYGVDGETVDGQDLSAVVSKIKGEEGTTVTLTIQRTGEKKPLEFTLTRTEISSPTVSSEMLDGDIGYIAISSFEEVTVDQFREALDQLEEQGEKALIIDLRNNGGGLLSTAVEMLDRLLPQGVVVYTKDKDGKKQEYSSSDEESFDKPIAILVNGNSASASEVFSGALQDYGKAVLVGTTTFGKGIVQTVFDLSDGTGLKLTTSKYYTPKGRNIHGTGLEPDISVELNGETFQQKNSELVIDNQTRSAVEYLKKQ